MYLIVFHNVYIDLQVCEYTGVSVARKHLVILAIVSARVGNIMTNCHVGKEHRNNIITANL